MSGKWVKCRLDRVAVVNPKATALPDKFVYIDLESVKNGKLLERKIVAKHNAPSRAQRTLRSGDILFQLVRPYQQNNLFFNPDDSQDYVASTGYAQIRVEDNSVDTEGCDANGQGRSSSAPKNKFFYYLLHQQEFLNRVLSLCTGSGYPAIAPSELARIIITCPSVTSVLHHIAEILSTCDEVIEKSERAKEKLRRIKDGLLADLMTRGIGKDGKIRPRPSKAPHLYKQSELGLIPKEWDVKRLGDVCEEPQYGLNAAAVDYDGVHGYVRITDIDDDTHQFMHEGITSPAEFSDSYILKEGDIVLSRTGASVGKSYVYDPKDGLLYFAGFLIRFRCHSDVNHRYVFSQLLTKRYWNWVSAVSMRTGQPGVNAEEYSTYRIVVPQKKDEQDQIADRLAAVDARIESEENAIAKYRKIKAGLMHRLLTPPSGAEIVDLAEGAT